MKKAMLFLIVVGLLCSNGALASDRTTSLPAPKSQMSMEGIQFVTGGTGITERQILDRMADKYNLKVVLADKKGHYLARCDVEIIRADGTKILSTTTGGPWLLADLKPGKYQVKARFNNIWQGQKIVISKNPLQQIILNW